MIQSSERIKHLYWRAGFGLSPEEWIARKDWSVRQAVQQLFEEADEQRLLSTTVRKPDLSEKDKKLLSTQKKKQLMREGRRNLRVLRTEWISRMGDPDQSALLEKMSLFWHGHFACTSKGPYAAFQQLSTIRRHALGNFRDFVKAIARDAAMIRFLNNQQNRKLKPNENFARELMELFTIGRGNYTEQDVKEAARAFTGWASNAQGEFVFRKRHHDFGSKTFLGQRGNFDGDEIIDLLLEKKETAHFICQKVFRFFVNEQLDEKRVAELTDHFYKKDYDIRQLMQFLFTRSWFYKKKHVGSRIKSPVEFIAGMIRTLGAEMKDEKPLSTVQNVLGQVLFDPPNVAGWPGGKTWIDNSTLLVRLNMANYLATGSDFELRTKNEFKAAKRTVPLRKIQATVNMDPLIQIFEKENLQDSFTQIADYLIVPSHNYSKAFFDPFTINTDRVDYVKTIAIRLMSLPEYQLC